MKTFSIDHIYQSWFSSQRRWQHCTLSAPRTQHGRDVAIEEWTTMAEILPLRTEHICRFPDLCFCFIVEPRMKTRTRLYTLLIDHMYMVGRHILDAISWEVLTKKLLRIEPIDLSIAHDGLTLVIWIVHLCHLRFQGGDAPWRAGGFASCLNWLERWWRGNIWTLGLLISSGTCTK